MPRDTAAGAAWGVPGADDEVGQRGEKPEREKAAQLRDKLYQIKEAMFGVALPVET